jgi:hypothetical protein
VVGLGSISSEGSALDQGRLEDVRAGEELGEHDPFRACASRLRSEPLGGGEVRRHVPDRRFQLYSGNSNRVFLPVRSVYWRGC